MPADSEPFRGNNRDILKELARKIVQKYKSATYPRRTIFFNEEVERKFRRSWFGKTISVTETSKDLESVNPQASVSLPVPSPPTDQPLSIFITQDSSSLPLSEELLTFDPSWRAPLQQEVLSTPFSQADFRGESELSLLSSPAPVPAGRTEPELKVPAPPRSQGPAQSRDFRSRRDGEEDYG